MNTFYIHELGRLWAEAPYGSEEYNALSAKLDTFSQQDYAAVIRASEKISGHYSMWPGHRWERAHIQFAG